MRKAQSEKESMGLDQLGSKRTGPIPIQELEQKHVSVETKENREQNKHHIRKGN